MLVIIPTFQYGTFETDYSIFKLQDYVFCHIIELSTVKKEICSFPFNLNCFWLYFLLLINTEHFCLSMSKKIMPRFWNDEIPPPQSVNENNKSFISITHMQCTTYSYYIKTIWLNVIYAFICMNNNNIGKMHKFIQNNYPLIVQKSKNMLLPNFNRKEEHISHAAWLNKINLKW